MIGAPNAAPRRSGSCAPGRTSSTARSTCRSADPRWAAASLSRASETGCARVARQAARSARAWTSSSSAAGRPAPPSVDASCSADPRAACSIPRMRCSVNPSTAWRIAPARSATQTWFPKSRVYARTYAAPGANGNTVQPGSRPQPEGHHVNQATDAPGWRWQPSPASAKRGRGSNFPSGKRKRLLSKAFLILPYRQQDRLTVI